MAWLDATPKEKEQSRRKERVEGHPELEMLTLSRYERFLLELWLECGVVSQGANGLEPLRWSEIESWARQFYSETYIEWVEHPRQSKRHKIVFTPIPLAQCTLLDSELKLIHRLSQEYSVEYSLANDPQRPCPRDVSEEEVPEIVAVANAENIMDSFQSLFGKQDDQAVESVPNK